MAQTFRNNSNLQQFMLTDVTSTDRILGTGSYGSVVEVSKSTGSLLDLSNLYYIISHLSFLSSSIGILSVLARSSMRLS